MKKILIEFDDKVYENLKQEMLIKINMGDICELGDEVLISIVKTIEHGNSELKLSYKRGKEDD